MVCGRYVDLITRTLLHRKYQAEPSKWVVSLSGCDALLSMLETGVPWYGVGPGTLRAPATRVTPPSSRHDRSGLRRSRGAQVARYAVRPRHGSAPALVTV